VESSLSPADESTRVGCFVQRIERHERPNGGTHASLQSRRIVSRPHKFKSQRLGDGELFIKTRIYIDFGNLNMQLFKLLYRLGWLESWASHNFKTGKIIIMLISNCWPTPSSGSYNFSVVMVRLERRKITFPLLIGDSWYSLNHYWNFPYFYIRNSIIKLPFYFNLQPRYNSTFKGGHTAHVLLSLCATSESLDGAVKVATASAKVRAVR
jgi:hypothetical protein